MIFCQQMFMLLDRFFLLIIKGGNVNCRLSEYTVQSSTPPFCSFTDTALSRDKTFVSLKWFFQVIKAYLCPHIIFLLELFLMETWHMLLYFFTWNLQMWIQLSLTWASHDKHPFSSFAIILLLFNSRLALGWVTLYKLSHIFVLL